jgi:NAD(P)-dependent dehydrogenase (short-subunit alcohol dehydrogenase family)
MTEPKPAVLVTGAAKRLGAAIAMRFARAGHPLVLHYNSSAQAAEALSAALVAEGAPKPALLPLDLSALPAIAPAMARLAETQPDVGILVNSASVFAYDRAAAPDLAVWQEAAAVNFWAPVALAHAFARDFGPEERRVVNVLDQKLTNLNPDYFSYTAAKAALAAAAQMLAQDFAGRLRIANVAPGLVLPSGDQTEAEFEASATLNPLRRRTTPDDIAEAVYFAATGPLRSGETIHVDGGQRLVAQARDVIFLARGEG